MSLFQLPVGPQAGQAPEGPNWGQYGLDNNPFPESGVTNGPLYLAHVTGVAVAINDWIQKVNRATALERERPDAVQPFALYGGNGTGKSHLAHSVVRGLRANPLFPVVQRSFTDEGSSRLTLANLLVRHLPVVQVGADHLTLFEALLHRHRNDPTGFKDAVVHLPRVSLVRDPLLAVCHAKAEQLGDLVIWLSRWLRRESTTPAQLAKLRLSATLRGEGETLGVIADLVGLARNLQLLQAWFVFIDQLEDLWGPGLSANRRARFLQDLRTLVDAAVERGAPIAVWVTWNTTTQVSGRGARGSADQLLERDYNALWERLKLNGGPHTLVGLRDQDLWPFAEAYLRVVGVDDLAHTPRPRRTLCQALKACEPQVKDHLRSTLPGDRYPARQVLDAWRYQAQALA